VANGTKGQLQPPPGLSEVWELAHIWRVWPILLPDLMDGSAFPQETLNLLICVGDWEA
jgi:hypothetical protein